MEKDKKVYAVTGSFLHDGDRVTNVFGIYDTKSSAIERMEKEIEPLLAKGSYIYANDWHIRTCEPDYFLAQRYYAEDGEEPDEIYDEMIYYIKEYVLNK